MMERRDWLGWAATTALTVVGLSSAGCGTRVPLAAPEQVVGDALFVRVKEAYVVGDRVYVKTWMKNQTDQVMTIDRDGMQLKLEGGAILDRSSGKTTQHTPYSVAPGVGRDVHVDFRGDADTLQTMDRCWLVLGGISVGKETAGKSVGELELKVSAAAE
jgi:hypothetical protein